MPDETWSITSAEKDKIREFGRKLNLFIREYFKDEKSIHLKLIAGGFQYIMQLHNQGAKLIADDFAIANAAVLSFGLAGSLEEPFENIPDPVPPTMEERKAYLEAELKKLSDEEATLNASPAPSVTAENLAPTKPEVAAI